MEKILFNAKLFRHDGSFSEACAISSGKISAIGTNDEILKLKTSTTECIDAKDNLVIPGINDSHMHLYNVGVLLQSVVLYNQTSLNSILESGKKFIETNQVPSGQLIFGMGWNQDYFTDEHRFPNRHDLDQISTEHPILFRRACGHVLVCNTKALEVAGINQNTPEIEGGQVDREADGYPTGLFRENAMVYISKLQKSATLEDMKKTILTAAQYAASNGITSVQTNDLNTSSSDYMLIIQAYKELADAGLLPLRVYLQCCFMEFNLFEKFVDDGFYTGKGDENFKIGPLKLFVDGSLGARTAKMRNPYHDDPTTTGIQTLTPEQTNQFVKKATESNFSVAVHAIGDGAIEQILNSYQTVYDSKQGNHLRNSIVHCQITDTGLLQRFADMDILALVQPIFLHYDMHIVRERVGNDLAKTSYAFKTMQDLGITAAYGTDSPVENLNPWECIYCAVTRKDLPGTTSFETDECVSVEAAIRSYTENSAYVSYEEKFKGQIEVGMAADLVITSQNLFEIESNLIKDTTSLLTMKAGNITHRKDI